MARRIIHILLSVFLILMASCTIFYIYWELNQPKTGVMGNGPIAPSFIQMLPIYCALLAGILNLVLGIHRYVKYKNEPE